MPMPGPGATVGGGCGNMDLILTDRQRDPQRGRGGGTGGEGGLTRAPSRSLHSSKALSELTPLINSNQFCLRQA